MCHRHPPLAASLEAPSSLSGTDQTGAVRIDILAHAMPAILLPNAAPNQDLLAVLDVCDTLI